MRSSSVPTTVNVSRCAAAPTPSPVTLRDECVAAKNAVTPASPKADRASLAPRIGGERSGRGGEIGRGGVHGAASEAEAGGACGGVVVKRGAGGAAGKGAVDGFKVPRSEPDRERVPILAGAVFSLSIGIASSLMSRLGLLLAGDAAGLGPLSAAWTDMAVSLSSSSW